MAPQNEKHPYFVDLDPADISEINVYRLERQGTSRKNNPPKPMLVAWEWDVAKFRGERTIAPIAGGGVYQCHAMDRDGARILANLTARIEGEPRVPPLPPSAALAIGAPWETSNGIVAMPGLSPRINLLFMQSQMHAHYFRQSHAKLEEGVLLMLAKFAAQQTPADLINEFRSQMTEQRAELSAMRKKLDEAKGKTDEAERALASKKGSGLDKLWSRLGDKVPDTLEELGKALKGALETYQEMLAGESGGGGSAPPVDAGASTDGAGG